MSGFERQHHHWHGNGDWDAECCLCALNPCKNVSTIEALWHLHQSEERLFAYRERFQRTWGVKAPDGNITVAKDHAEACHLQGVLNNHELVYQDCSAWEETPW